METQLRIRPIAESDDLNGLSPVWGAPLDFGGSPPANGVVVVRDGAVVGLAVTAPAPPGLQVAQLHTHAATPASEVLSAVTTTQARVELYARDAPELVHEVAEAAGFELVFSQVRVGRSLTGVNRPSTRRFTFRRFCEVGRRGMRLMLAGIWEGRAGPNRLPADLELERLLDLARPGPGEPPETSLWRVAYHAGDPAGVALVNNAGGSTGTLGYIGLLRELRGRGLGRALHAEALWSMRSSGLERYEDGTGWDNAPMRAIFAAAGCEPIGSAVMFVKGASCDEPAGGDRTTFAPGEPRLPLGSHVSLLRKVPTRSEATR